MGFKPIFEEERQFFAKKTGILLPEECWRNGNKIYLDYTQETPYITFKVVDKEIKIQKDNRTKVSGQKSIAELIEENRARIEKMFYDAVVRTADMVEKHQTHFYIVGNSGGKDSDIVYLIWQAVLKELERRTPHSSKKLDWVINFANTSNDTADTYKKVKQLPKDRLRILNPSIGFYPWVTKIKNYMVPTVLMRNCCSTYKEGQIYKAYDTKRPTIQVLGVRRYESTKRAKYAFYMDGDYYKSIIGSNSLPKMWAVIAPAIEFRDEDVWLYLLDHDVPFNRQYRLGFSRCGCLVCPYQTGYTDLLIEEFYPKTWERWIEILKNGYEINHVQQNFKWTLQEYLNGQWKEGKSKERYIITKKATPDRIRELAELKGISYNMAAKYFGRICAGCGKKLNATEIAMFYKMNGRQEDNTTDNRPMLCKKCFCKKNDMKQKDYMKLVYEFVDSGCNLF